MSKPILSELEYNASDVASAILSKADLSVTNEDLGVTDRSSLFTIQAGWSSGDLSAYSFNGFMFISAYFSHSGGEPDNGETVWVISDSDFFPTELISMPSISYEGDNALRMQFQTDGDVTVSWATDTGSSSTWYGCINGFYRFT